MKPLLSLVLATFALAICAHGAEPGSKDAAAVPEAAPRVSRSTNGQVIVTLDSATRQAAGVETVALAAAALPPEIKAHGRVLDPAPLAALTGELIAARAVEAAAQAELARLQTLSAQTNASQRALQTAQADASKNQAQVESIRLRLLAGWGAVSAQRDLPAFVQALSTGSAALVQLSLPPGDQVKGAPLRARILGLAEEQSPVPGEYLGPAPMVDPQLQGRGFLFLVASNTPSLLIPGQAVTALLTLPGESRAGVHLPARALVRFQGAAWVYRQRDENAFERVHVILKSPVAEGWFVAGELKPGEKVVATGAQLLLAEELKGSETE